VPSWDGVIVVDTTNPRFGPGPDEVYDTGALTSSEVVAGLVPGARLVKAFNHQPIPSLAAELGPSPTERNALFLAGDDPGAKAVVAGLMRDPGRRARMREDGPVFAAEWDTGVSARRLIAVYEDLRSSWSNSPAAAMSAPA